MTHCLHEVMQAQWRILLDDEFLEAYKHGIVIECCDGINCVLIWLVSDFSPALAIRGTALALDVSSLSHVSKTWECDKI